LITLIPLASDAQMYQVYFAPKYSKSIFIVKDSTTTLDKIKTVLIMNGYTIASQTETSIKTEFTSLNNSPLDKINFTITDVTLDSGKYWVFKGVFDNSTRGNIAMNSFAGSSSTLEFKNDISAHSPNTRSGKAFIEMIRIAQQFNKALNFGPGTKKGYVRFELMNSK
jgi:hypothetical protein